MLDRRCARAVRAQHNLVRDKMVKGIEDDKNMREQRSIDRMTEYKSTTTMWVQPDGNALLGYLPREPLSDEAVK
jgi:hypothetical protein